MPRVALCRTLLCVVVALTAALAAGARAQSGGEILDTDLHVAFSGLAFVRSTNTFDTSATLTNTSTTTFTGDFSIVLPTIVPLSATLANATCQTTDGKPILVASFPPAGLAPGAQLSNVVLKFSNPQLAPLSFAHVVIAGNICTEKLQFRAFSDSRTLPEPADVAAILPALALAYCQSEAANPMTLTTAMASIQTRLDELAGPGALEGFLAGAAQTNEAELVALATAATADNKGPGALAALLAAHQNDPTNPAHLVNAAAAASLIGMPNEALALLDGADALNGDYGTPMGIDGLALAQNNRGFALMQLGQWSAAQTLFSAASSREPLLSEARFNLAVAMLCQGNADPAAYLAGLRRSPPQTLDQTFDLSAGVPLDMPPLPYPATPAQLAPYASTLGKIAAGTLAKITSSLDQRDDVFNQLQAQMLANPPPQIVQTRSADIYGAGDGLGIPAFDERSPRGLSDLWSVTKASYNVAVQFYDETAQKFGVWANKRNAALLNCTNDLPYCSADYQNVLLQGRTQVRQRLSAFTRIQGRFDRATRAFADPWYRALTGLAANLGNPLSHQYRSLQAQVDGLWVYENLAVTGGNNFGSLGSWWLEAQGSDAPGDLPIVLPDPQQSVACPDALKGQKFKFASFGSVNVSISCEQIEATIQEPGLGPFAQVTIPRKGDWTVFAGAAASLPIPGLKVGSKIGLFIRGNDQGFTDAGFKTTQTVTGVKAVSNYSFEAGIVAASQCFLGCD